MYIFRPSLDFFIRHDSIWIELSTKGMDSTSASLHNQTQIVIDNLKKNKLRSACYETTVSHLWYLHYRSATAFRTRFWGRKRVVDDHRWGWAHFRLAPSNPVSDEGDTGLGVLKSLEALPDGRMAAPRAKRRGHLPVCHTTTNNIWIKFSDNNDGEKFTFVMLETAALVSSGDI